MLCRKTKIILNQHTSGMRNAGRNFDSNLSFCMGVLALFADNINLRIERLNLIGTSDKNSTPPEIAASIWPVAN